MGRSVKSVSVAYDQPRNEREPRMWNDHERFSPRTVQGLCILCISHGGPPFSKAKDGPRTLSAWRWMNQLHFCAAFMPSISGSTPYSRRSF